MPGMSELNGQVREPTEAELAEIIETIPTPITDGPTLRQMALAYWADQHGQPAPEPEPVEQAEPQKKLPRVVLQKRFDLALRDWLAAQATQPRRIARWLAWWIALPWRVGSFAAVMLGGNVDAETLLDRDTECNDCEQRYFFVRRNGAKSSHCAACKCPAWKFSTLKVKNQRAGWKCPLRKHEGPYSNDRQIETLKVLGYEENAALSAAGSGGCTGCGCGKAKQGG
jgi:hypothetical protein